MCRWQKGKNTSKITTFCVSEALNLRYFAKHSYKHETLSNAIQPIYEAIRLRCFFCVFERKQNGFEYRFHQLKGIMHGKWKKIDYLIFSKAQRQKNERTNCDCDTM